MTERFELTTTIKTHKGETRVLELAMPKAKSFMVHGPIVKNIVSGPPGDRRDENCFNYTAILGFVSDMTGIDILLLEHLSAYDLDRLGYVVLGLVKLPPPMSSSSVAA